MKKATTIGGQALIEGIMMKGPDKTAIAVRVPDKSIDVSFMPEKHIKDRFPILGWPILRGAVVFVESMIQGYKALMISADKSGMTDLDEQEAKPEEKEAAVVTEQTPDEPASQDAENKDGVAAQPGEKQSGKAANALISVVMIVGCVLGVGLAVFLFMYLPAFIFDLCNHLTGNALSAGIRPLFEGVLKIAVFIAYIALVSLTKDIHRVFMYHGAEHKTIFCYEKGLELTVENVMQQKRFHPRCGTSFMIIMLVVGILISFLTLTVFPGITHYRILWVTVKILLVPFVCGLGYELIKICGRYDNLVTRIIAAPGMWVQRITTKEPEADMVEVAIASLQAVIPEDPDKDRW